MNVKHLLVFAVLFLLVACAPNIPAPTPIPTAILTPTSSPVPPTPTIPPTDCNACHPEIFSNWQKGVHANTQTDVATELVNARSGQTPNDVINGPDPEDCIACHAPLAVTLSGITSESAALGHFFTTTDGKFSATTTVADTANWPHDSCGTCHAVSDNHTGSKIEYGIFNSQTARFTPLTDSSQVCGQCHGNLLIPTTDHQVYNAWITSKHSATQTDVATELGASRKDQTPDEVINGSDSENCIACHAPTAVLANGGMGEAETLNYFFTTTNGKFTADTAVANATEWSNVSCTACHDPHNPKTPAYFNSSTKLYEPMATTSDLCGQCHGNLRFPKTDHLSYNIIAGKGGVGVPDMQMMPNATCVDCHMYVSGVDGSNSTQMGGHSWAITVNEPDGGTTTSCTKCHSSLDTQKSSDKIAQLKADYQALDTQAQDIVGKATTAMNGVTNPDLQAKLNEAQSNLSYAESDESGGFHNNTYLMALLNDSVQRAQEILTALGK